MSPYPRTRNDRLGRHGRRGRIGIRISATILATAAAATVGATAGHASTPSAGAATGQAGTTSDTTTLTLNRHGLPGMWSDYVPHMQCPTGYPYVLDKHFNPGSGFRLTAGVEFADYKQGFDAVAMRYDRVRYTRNDIDGWIHTGIDGARDPVMNSVTYWHLGGSTDWTVKLHCTSDPAKAAFDAPKNP